MRPLLPLFFFAPFLSLHAQERPNIILLVADDIGYGDLSCYGTRRVLTPAVDSLAADGLRFTDAHACASTSTPSRYGLLTGEYPFRRRGTDVAAGNAGMIIPAGTPTVASLLKSAGYRTAALGKWHLGLGSETGRQDWNGLLDQSPADLGFDYHYIMAATADRVPCVYIENGRVANYDPAAPIYVSYKKNFEGEPTGRTHPELLTKLRPSHGHDQAIVNGISRIGFSKGGGRALWHDENIADSIITHAISFIEQNAPAPSAAGGNGSPFFMYLCTNDIHVPRYPHERFRGKSPLGLRGDAILQFDDTVRRLTAALRRLNLYDNTLIIITSDNGPVLDDGYFDQAVPLALGEHAPSGHKDGVARRGAKYSAYEGGSGVPFIVHWPAGIGKKAKGTVSDALVSLIDVPATLAALAGAAVPASAAPDSENHLATWLGRSGRPRAFALNYSSGHNLTLRTPQWKLIPSHPGNARITWGPDVETGNAPVPQLYDLRNDPGERHNLADKKPALVKKLQTRLDELKRQPAGRAR